MFKGWDDFKKWLFKPKPDISGMDDESRFGYVEEHGTGALPDPRSASEKLEDIHFAEIVASAMLVDWLYKSFSQWRKFPIFNQNGSGGCVAFTMAKLLGIMRFIQDGFFVAFSGGDIYRRRPNTQSAGMVGTDAFAIAAQGVTLEAVLPSQNLSEEAINALKPQAYANEIAQLFKLGNPKPIILPSGDIDAVASVIKATGKGVMVWFYFTYPEWTDTPKMADVSMGVYDPRSLHHSVTAVDYTLMADGKKALVIDDQWGLFGPYNGQRLVDETFFKTRNFFSAYPMNLKHVQVTDVIPSDVRLFTKPLQFLSWDEAANQPSSMSIHEAQKVDVMALQKILQILTDERGNTFFPTNVTASGYYGATTAKAVYLWQSSRQVTAQVTLDTLAGKSFGTASIKQMNTELLA